MQDFLKDRPVLTSQEVTVSFPAAATSAAGTSAAVARIVRDQSLNPLPRATTTVTKPAGAAAPVAAHTSQVKTIMENGRVARLIVTCSCGKVTEIACVY